MKNSHNWLFHPNDYTGLWHAAKREDKDLLFNNIESPKVLKGQYVEDLRQLIDKTDGDPDKLPK